MRAFVSVLIRFCFVLVFTQNSSAMMVQPEMAQNYILDNYDDVNAAVSVRRLTQQTYGGPLMRVRRESDNAEQDIYFTLSGLLDTAQLLSFCSATNCFVVDWYDQGPSGNDATQANASRQPQIVTAGSLEVDANGDVGVKYDGVLDCLLFPVLVLDLDATASASAVGYWDYDNTRSYVLTEGDVVSPYSSNFIFNQAVAGTGALWVNGSTIGAAPTNGPSSTAFVKTGGAGTGSRVFQTWQSGASLGTGNATVNSSVLTTVLGNSGVCSSGSAPYNKTIQEMIMWQVDKTSDMIAITNEIESFYDRNF